MTTKNNSFMDMVNNAVADLNANSSAVVAPSFNAMQEAQKAAEGKSKSSTEGKAAKKACAEFNRVAESELNERIKQLLAADVLLTGEIIEALNAKMRFLNIDPSQTIKGSERYKAARKAFLSMFFVPSTKDGSKLVTPAEGTPERKIHDRAQYRFDTLDWFIEEKEEIKLPAEEVIKRIAKEVGSTLYMEGIEKEDVAKKVLAEIGKVIDDEIQAAAAEDNPAE